MKGEVPGMYFPAGRECREGRIRDCSGRPAADEMEGGWEVEKENVGSPKARISQNEPASAEPDAVLDWFWQVKMT